MLQGYHIADASPFIEAVGVPRKQYYCDETDILKDEVCNSRIYLLYVLNRALKLVVKSQMLKGFHIVKGMKQGKVVEIATSKYKLNVKYVLKINHMSFWKEEWLVGAQLYLQ